MAYIAYLSDDKLSNNIAEARDPIGTFDPNARGGLNAWYRADSGILLPDDLTPVPDLGKIYRWNDLSGLGNNAFNIIEDRKPVWKDNQLNGEPIVSFTKENLQYLIASNQGNFNIDTPTIFLVGKWYSGAGFFGKGDGGQSDARHRKLMITPFGSGTLFSYWAGTDAMSGNTVSATCTNWNIYIIRAFRNNYTNFNINGVETRRTTPVVDNTSHNTAQFTLGCGFQHGAEFATVDIAEVRIYRRLLTDLEVRGLVDYASTRYGISVTNVPPAVIPARDVVSSRDVV